MVALFDPDVGVGYCSNSRRRGADAEEGNVNDFIVGLVVAGLVAVLVIAVLALFAPQRSCPKCGNPLPRLRMPKSISQALRGGWICPNCGTEVDRAGRRVR